MRLGQIIVIVLASIVTWIGLVVSKLYEKYIKKNIIVQLSLYAIWTIGILRVLYWVAKPLLKGIITNNMVHITIVEEPSLLASLLVLGVSVIMFVLVGKRIMEIKND